MGRSAFAVTREIPPVRNIPAYAAPPGRVLLLPAIIIIIVHALWCGKCHEIVRFRSRERNENKNVAGGKKCRESTVFFYRTAAPPTHIFRARTTSTPACCYRVRIANARTHTYAL